MTTLSYAPDYQIESDTKPEVHAVKFGDGYAQRLTYGLNQSPEAWTLEFKYRDSTEADNIISFFASLKGVDNFTWTPPGEATAKKYIATQWRKRVEQGNRYSITVQIEQTFDP